MESPDLCLEPEGPAVVETYTVVHDRTNEPEYSVVIARLESGERCFAQTDEDRDLLLAMESEEFVGKKGFIRKGVDAPNRMKF